MQIIEFTYTSTNINPSVSILLFLRLIGIYVYERFFDYGEEEEYSMFAQFPEVKRENKSWMSDAYVWFIDNERQINTFLDSFTANYKRRKTATKFLIISSVIQEGFAEFVEHFENLYYVPYEGDNECVIKKLTDIIESSVLEKKTLRKVADIYCRQSLWKLSMKGKYFYPANTPEQFYAVREAYRNAVASIRTAMEECSVELGGSSGKYMQYAMCNLAYESNLYCIKNKKSKLYAARSIMDPLISLVLSERKEGNGYNNNIQQLIAQIYEDLLKEPNRAYDFYLESCKKPYNAFAFFRKANYWISFGENTEKAVKYYLQSVARFPEYYRVWFNLGICYVQIGNYRKALDALRNVKIILRNRRQEAVLRPMELDYLFRAYCCSGYIRYQYFRDIHTAVKEDVEAAALWTEIDSSKFWEILGDSEETETLKDTLKTKFDIRELYRVIIKLAMKIGDTYLMEEYRIRLQEGDKTNDEWKKVSN